MHEIGIDSSGRLDDGLGEERGPVREVVMDQGRVDAGVARDTTQGGLVAVAGEGGAGRRQDGLTRVRAPRRPPPPRAPRSLVSLMVRACPQAAPLGSSRATAPNRRATLRTQAGAASFIVPATSRRALSDVVDQPFMHVPKDSSLHDSDLLGETLTRDRAHLFGHGKRSLLHPYSRIELHVIRPAPILRCHGNHDDKRRHRSMESFIGHNEDRTTPGLLSPDSRIGKCPPHLARLNRGC